MSIKRTINTNLLKKLETFRVMALGEAVGTPILLIGPPGVAKTAAVIDYAKAAGNGNIDDADLFLLETDEGTRSNAIKGNIDLEELTLNQKYRVDSPITSAKFVVINEIDKASASLRNSLLGIMNEKILFNGTEKVPCEWQAFIATCNSIPDDEVGSPFWDRFLVTFHVNRLRQADILDYYAKGGKVFNQNHNIQIPEQSDIDAITIDPIKLKKVIDLIYTSLSDRSLSFLPTIIKNIMVVWKFNEDRAIVKCVELLVDKSAAKTISKSLVSKELRAIYDAIDGIGQCISMDAYSQQFDKVEALCEQQFKSGKLKQEDVEDIKNRVDEQEDKLEFLKKEEDVLTEMANNS
jgi:hypothetical protein